MVPDPEICAEIFKIVQASKTTYELSAEKPDYDMQVFEALKAYFLDAIDNQRGILAHGHIETLEDFQVRTNTFKEKMSQYGRENVKCPSMELNT